MPSPPIFTHISPRERRFRHPATDDLSRKTPILERLTNPPFSEGDGNQPPPSKIVQLRAAVPYVMGTALCSPSRREHQRPPTTGRKTPGSQIEEGADIRVAKEAWVATTQRCKEIRVFFLIAYHILPTRQSDRYRVG